MSLLAGATLPVATPAILCQCNCHSHLVAMRLEHKFCGSKTWQQDLPTTLESAGRMVLVCFCQVSNVCTRDHFAGAELSMRQQATDSGCVDAMYDWVVYDT
eukprot:6464096-Amphidinium_carterae.3